MAETSSAKPARGPFYVARKGSASVAVYAGSRTVNGKVYPLFTVSSYRPDGTRYRRAFGKAEDAKRDADRQAGALAAGHHEAAKLTTADADLYTAAIRKLADAKIPKSLIEVADEYVSAIAKLPPGVSLRDAVDDFSKRHPANAPRRTVPEVVAEMIEEKSRANLSSEHLRDLRKRLVPFGEAFQVNVRDLTAGLVRDYLNGLSLPGGEPVAPRTRLNGLRAICGLLHFARKRKYVARELVDEVAEIDLPKAGGGEIGVFTVAAMRAMLAGAAPDILPVLAIGAFAGLRTAELSRLDWSEVKLGEAVIVVGADKAKTAQRRIVPIQPNLAAWLAPYARTDGPVNPSTDDRGMNHRLVRGAAVPAGVAWVRNGLRHSFISYRLAVTQDAARVATEAGNSPSIVHKHYKALVTEATGRDWFSLTPSGEAAKILPLAATAFK